MKYNIKEFNKTVNYYKNRIKRIKNKNILVVSEISNKEAFFSLAPFSMAVHELGKEINVILKERKSNIYEILKEVYQTYEDHKRGIKNEKTVALVEFIREAEKKTKGKFEKLFKRPGIIEVDSSFDGLDFKTGWYRGYKRSGLDKAARKIWKCVYAIKPSDRVSIGFEVIPKKNDLELPLEDYLDSYAISWAMIQNCKVKKSSGSATAKKSPLEKSEPVSDLKATLIGCELSKNVKEPVFMKFKKLSKLLKIDRIELPTASFSIHGKGYGGKHLFGETIGYPSPDRKTRWLNPGGIIYKLDWNPQTRIDKRPPRARVAFTETLPIDVFIQTCNINWKDSKGYGKMR